MLVQREKQVLRPSAPTWKKIPRKRSEEYWDSQVHISSETPIIRDSWLYQWTACPPKAFVHHKTIFRSCTPLDIVQNGWTLLKPAVHDIAGVFSLPVPDDVDDQKDLTMLKWLSLSHVGADKMPFWKRPCSMGIYGDEYVVAATLLSRKMPPFIPFNLYLKLRENKLWRNLRYRAGYQMFQARFDTGQTFYTEQQNLFCSVRYGLTSDISDFTERSYLWAVLDIEGVLLPTPCRTCIAPDFSDLPGKVEQVTTDCYSFVRRLGAAWLREVGTYEVYKWLRRRLSEKDLPEHMLTSLRQSSLLDKCLNRLDVLRAVMQMMNLKSDEDIPLYVSLVQRLAS